MEAIFEVVHKLLICTSGAILVFGFMLVYVMVKEVKGGQDESKARS